MIRGLCCLVCRARGHGSLLGGAGLAAVAPEFRQRFGFAPAVHGELQKRPDGEFPKFFRPFHRPANPLDRRSHLGRGDR